MSVYLARQFAMTNKDLEKKFIEVKTLSEKTIEQEREKQKILETQVNITLLGDHSFNVVCANKAELLSPKSVVIVISGVINIKKASLKEAL